MISEEYEERHVCAKCGRTETVKYTIHINRMTKRTVLESLCHECQYALAGLGYSVITYPSKELAELAMLRREL